MQSSLQPLFGETTEKRSGEESWVQTRCASDWTKAVKQNDSGEAVEGPGGWSLSVSQCLTESPAHHLLHCTHDLHTPLRSPPSPLSCFTSTDADCYPIDASPHCPREGGR